MTFEINGKSYEITVDGFGVQYIDGMLIDDFYATLSEEDIRYCMNIGIQTALSDPDYFNDITNRHEIPVKAQNGKFVIS